LNESNQKENRSSGDMGSKRGHGRVLQERGGAFHELSVGKKERGRGKHPGKGSTRPGVPYPHSGTNKAVKQGGNNNKKREKIDISLGCTKSPSWRKDLKGGVEKGEPGREGGTSSRRDGLPSRGEALKKATRTPRKEKGPFNQGSLFCGRLFLSCKEYNERHY